MVNYNNGKVYKICCNITNKIYVGSTTCELSHRLATHVSNYKKFLNGKYHYVTSFKILEKGDYSIILLEKCPCSSRDELAMRERYWYDTLECVNKNKPSRCFAPLDFHVALACSKQ